MLIFSTWKRKHPPFSLCCLCSFLHFSPGVKLNLGYRCNKPHRRANHIIIKYLNSKLRSATMRSENISDDLGKRVRVKYEIQHTFHNKFLSGIRLLRQLKTCTTTTQFYISFFSMTIIIMNFTMT